MKEYEEIESRLAKVRPRVPEEFRAKILDLRESVQLAEEREGLVSRKRSRRLLITSAAACLLLAIAILKNVTPEDDLNQPITEQVTPRPTSTVPQFSITDSGVILRLSKVEYEDAPERTRARPIELNVF